MDERGMDNRPSALRNRFSPLFYADRIFLLKVSVANAKNVQLRRRRENFCYFVLK